MGIRIKKISKYTPSLFQGKFDFSNHAGGFSLSVEHPLERLAVRVLSAVLLCVICGYLYFVSASVLNVIARKDAISQISKIQGTIGGLEQQYYTLSQGVSPKAGATLGLTPVQSTEYVYQFGNVGAATMARNAL